MAVGTVYSAPDRAESRMTSQMAAQAAKAGVETLFWEKLAAAGQKAQAQGKGTQAAENNPGDTLPSEKDVFDYHKFFQDKINEIYTKVLNGDTEPTFQIGSLSLTEKEWNKFLEEFDAVQDAIREMMREEQEKKEAERLRKELLADTDAASLLAAHATSCVYPASVKGQEDTSYITWYTRDGIFCRSAGQTDGYEWSVLFEDEEQYDKVMELVGQFPSDWNLRFAAHENFWTDFLDGKLDTDSFVEFMKGTNRGVPDTMVTADGSVRFERDKVRWAKYLNKPGNQIYMREEFQRMVEAEIAANRRLKKGVDLPGGFI